jgi:hypothetical protein
MTASISIILRRTGSVLIIKNGTSQRSVNEIVNETNKSIWGWAALSVAAGFVAWAVISGTSLK